MTRQRARLLEDPETPKMFKVRLILQENRTAEFTYSERRLAREHYDFLRGTMLVGGFAVKEIFWEE